MNPVLYLIMRNDIPSMNPGKLAAQAAHVANAFEYEFNKNKKAKVALGRWYNAWKKQTKQGFGTTITLACPYDPLYGLNCGYKDGVFSGLVYDPTYPCEIPLEVAEVLQIGVLFRGVDNVILKSDKGIFLRKELVGGYVFGDKEDITVMKTVEGLELYP